RERKMMRAVSRGLVVAAMLCGTAAVWAEDDRAYTDGPVIQIAYVRTKYGMFDEYVKYLDNTYKKLMEEQKKAGIILDYGVYQAFPRGPHEPDIILTITYKNYAALDGLRDKVDPIMAKAFGSMESAGKAAVDRDKMRESLGGEVIQEIKLK